MVFLTLLLLLIFPLGFLYCYCVKSRSTTALNDIPVRVVSDADDLPLPIPPLNGMDDVTSAQANCVNDVLSNRHWNNTRVCNGDMVTVTSALTHTSFEGTHAVEEYPSQSYITFDGTHAVEEHSSQTYTDSTGTQTAEGYSSEFASAEIIPVGRGVISDHHFIVTSLEYNCQRARYPSDEEIGLPRSAPDLHARAVSK